MTKHSQPRSTVVQIWPFFRARHWYPHPAGWPYWIVATALDRTRDELDSLTGQEVIVNAALYRCVGVQACQHSPPWHANELIGLVVIAEDRAWSRA